MVKVVVCIEKGREREREEGEERGRGRGVVFDSFDSTTNSSVEISRLKIRA